MRGLGWRSFGGEHGGDFGLADAFAELAGDFAMAAQAEGTDVLEFAFAAAFDYREDVVGVPQRLAQAGFQSPVMQEGCAVGATGAFELAERSEGIDAAVGADAAVAFEDVFAEVCGLGAELPFVDAVGGAKGVAAGGDFEGTPAAEAASVGAARVVLAIDPAALKVSPWKRRGGFAGGIHGSVVRVGRVPVKVTEREQATAASVSRALAGGNAARLQSRETQRVNWERMVRY